MATFTGKDITIYFNRKDAERANPGFLDYNDCVQFNEDNHTCVTGSTRFFDSEAYGMNLDELREAGINENAILKLCEINVIIDVEKYYSECCVEVISVESKRTNKQDFIRIREDEKSITYCMNTQNDGYWGGEWNAQQDTFMYFVKNVETGEIAWGNITLIFENEEDIENRAEDIFIKLKEPLPNLLEIDISTFNPLNSAVPVAKIGYFDPAFFTNVQLAPDNNSALQFTINKEGCAWDCCDVKTDVEYWLNDSETGLQSKARVYFRKDCDEFEVNDILIEITGEVPVYTNIDVQSYNEHADIDVINLQQIPNERGTHEIVTGQDDDIVKYTFNKTSGYWNPTPKEDMFRYTAMRADGEIASAYIRIRKISSGSGSGSGSGKGSIMTVYLDNSTGTIVSMTGLTYFPPLGMNPPFMEADLTTLTPVIIKDVPGTHIISDGRIRIDLVSATVFKISIASGTPLVNSIAPLQSMQIFVTSAIALVPGTTSWSVNVLEANPLNIDQKSKLEIG